MTTKAIDKYERRYQNALGKAKTLLMERYAHRLEESAAYYQSPWAGAWKHVLDTYSQKDFYPVSSKTSRVRGDYFPFFRNEQELCFLRDASRICVGTNQHAQGMAGGLCAFIVGEGHVMRATANDDQDPGLVKAVQDWLDEWIEANDFYVMQQEDFLQSLEDGESFIRIFDDNGIAQLRFVWPEQVTNNARNDDEWSYGIWTPGNDSQNPRSYWVAVTETEGEVVHNNELFHLKRNTRRGVKRGLPDFTFGTKEVLDAAQRLSRNMGDGSAAREAIAYIRQHASGSRGDVEAFVKEQATFETPDPVTREPRYTQRQLPGEVQDVPEGLQYAGVPGNASTPASIEVNRLLLRSAGCRWNAPEWLISGDASNMGAYTSSLVAESPFVRRVKQAQASLARRYRKIAEAARDVAIMYGILPTDARSIDIQVTAPTAEVRNRLEEANVNQVYMGMSVKSPQTISQEQGLDWENEQNNIEAAMERKGPEAAALSIPGLGTFPGGGSQ